MLLENIHLHVDCLIVPKFKFNTGISNKSVLKFIQEMKKKAPTQVSSTAQKMKVMKTAFDNDLFIPPSKLKENIPPSKLKEAVSTSMPRPKFPENLKGCDWIQELSVTIRKTKKTQLPKERYC